MQTRDITGREINEKKIAPYEKKKKKNAKMEVPFSETKRISCGVNSIAEVIISKLH